MLKNPLKLVLKTMVLESRQSHLQPLSEADVANGANEEGGMSKYQVESMRMQHTALQQPWIISEALHGELGNTGKNEFWPA